MTVNGVRTNYLWDVAAGLPVIISDTSSVYVYGLGLIGRQIGAEVEYYHTDALGSVRNLTNGSGQNVGAYIFKPFGEPFFSSGSSNNPFQYTGQQNDAQAGLYYLRARYFEPASGRFLTQDPFKGFPTQPQSLNLYVYVLNNPLVYTDPSGYYGPADFKRDVQRAFEWYIQNDPWVVMGENWGEYYEARESGDKYGESMAIAKYYQFLQFDLGTPSQGGVCAITVNSRVSANALASGVPKPQKVIVIGENMNKRVIPYAKDIGATYYKPKPGVAEDNWMRNNQKWIQKQMREGVEIIDIGPDEERRRSIGPSKFYEMERAEIQKRNYPFYTWDLQK